MKIGDLEGYIDQNIKARIKAIEGDTKKHNLFDILGLFSSLLNNFKASEKG